MKLSVSVPTVGLSLTIIVGCSGTQSGSVTPAAVAQAKAHPESRSWMAPEAKGDDLLYVSPPSDGPITVLSYPRGKVVGQLPSYLGGEAVGECVDKAQDVWIVNQDPNAVVEYAHGGTTPLATLSDPDGYAYGCSVDPTTGDLAVTNSDGAVAIYPLAQGNPTIYNRRGPTLYCAYDDGGNLFVSFGTYALEELLKGSSTFRNITVAGSLTGGLTSLQWVGHGLVASAEDDRKRTQQIYSMSVSGTTATIVTTTNLGGLSPQQYVQFWVQNHAIIGPADRAHNYLEFWSYPKGGKAKKVDKHLRIWGEAVSLGKT